MQREIERPTRLLDESGELVQSGWAREPLLSYDRDDVAASWLRIKEWDYYEVSNDEFGVAFTVADLGYVGLVAAVWLDFVDGRYRQDDAVSLLPRGSFGLSEDPETGHVDLSVGSVDLEFVTVPDEHRLSVRQPDFDGGSGLTADLTLRRPPADDSVVVAHDWPDAPTRFYYNQKVNCLPASGTVTVDGTARRFDTDRSFGVLDWGRGVWPYRSTWYWGSASTRIDGTRAGWNLGYGFGDRSHGTENAIFYDGDLHKLDEVRFQFDDYLDAWQVTSSDGRFEMTFEPDFDRQSSTNLGLVKNVQHQVFGRYTGTFVLDSGESIQAEEVHGFAEEVYNRW